MENEFSNRFTIEHIRTAYYKLKSTIFYDSADLLLREQLVAFEMNQVKDEGGFLKYIFNDNEYQNYTKKSLGDHISFEEKLEVIADQLNHYHLNSDFFDQFLNKISAYLYPKKINNDPSDIISNVRIKDKYTVEKVSAFINAPIELHIIATLWTINEGVNKDARLVNECMGNRLLLNKDKSKIVQGSGLFKPYFKQYQKWRDTAVKTAKQLLENDKNTVFINLDIKDYYYSARIPYDYFKSEGENQDGYYNLETILEKIHEVFTRNLIKLKIPCDFENEVMENDAITNFVLPIGLISSMVIANDYLKEFDRAILEDYKPAYYGRYVDDILLVIADPNPLKELEKLPCEAAESEVAFKFSELNGIEKYLLKNFYHIIDIVPVPNSVKPEDRYIKLKGYSSLYCQSEKTVIHFFDKDESAVVIDKLKKEIEEKSSEFRDLPNDEDNLVNFEESAYHLLYEGSTDKVRTLKDYKEDRFGLSVYLTHKINIALRKTGKISDEEKDKILKFFKGENCLTFYKLWEKILTLFVVNNQPKAFVDFLFHGVEQIDRIYTFPSNYYLEFEIRKTLLEYLHFAYEMSISLNLNFLDSIRDFEFSANHAKNINSALNSSSFSFQSPYDKGGNPNFIGFRVRKTNMIRHHYVSVPLLNFTEGGISGKTNLIDKNLHIESYIIDKDMLENSPRPLKFWECCMASAFQKFQKFSTSPRSQTEQIDSNILYEVRDDAVSNEDTGLENQSYLDRAFELYQCGNRHHKLDYDMDENLKKKFFDFRVQKGDSFIINEFTVDSKNFLNNPKISFANTDVLEKNVIQSILGKPVLSSERINKLSKILKLARKADSEILLFPETFIPMRLFSTLCRFSVDNQMMAVSGIEHLTIKKTSFNFVATILPHKINNIKDATVILRLKNNYSPGEQHLINKHHLTVPKPKPARYQIINWRNIYFSVSYCFEMANITHREKLKGKIDLLIGIEWNRDTPYFSNIVEASSRDLHCYVAQVNTSSFGDTRLTQPKETALKDLLKLKGGLNDTILVGQIDIDKLRNFQRIKSHINTSKEFKPIPPDFELDDILKRIENKNLLDKTDNN